MTQPSSHENSQQQTTMVLKIEQAMDRIGYGTFQRRMLWAAGLCSASDAMEILMLSFLSLSVQEQWQLSSTQTSALISSVFGGAFMGTLLLGRLGDTWGRRPTFLVTAALVAGFGLLSAICTSYRQLLVARTMVGVGIGGVTVPFDTYGECLPAYCRGKGLVYPSYFWTTGTILVVLVAHGTLHENGNGWRWLCLWCAIPCVVATGVAYWVVPESPQWLLSAAATRNHDNHAQEHDQRHRQALLILRRAAQLNGMDPDEILPMNTILVGTHATTTAAAAAACSSASSDPMAPPPKAEAASATSVVAYTEASSMSPLPRETHSTTASTTMQSFHNDEDLSAAPPVNAIINDESSLWDLVSPQRLRSSLAILSIWYGYALLYYGTVLAITAVFRSSTATTTTATLNDDDDGQQEQRLYFDFGAILLASSAEWVATTFLILTIDKWGRRILHALSFGLGGIFVLGLAIAANATTMQQQDGDDDASSSHVWWLPLVLAFGGRLFIFSGSAVTWIWTAEVLETQHRTTGHGLANAGGRIGGFMSPWLVSPTQVSYMTMGLVLWGVSWVMVAVAWSSLPETLGTPMGTAVVVAGMKQDRGAERDDSVLEMGVASSPSRRRNDRNKAKDGYRVLRSSSSLV